MNQGKQNQKEVKIQNIIWENHKQIKSKESNNNIKEITKKEIRNKSWEF